MRRVLAAPRPGLLRPGFHGPSRMRRPTHMDSAMIVPDTSPNIGRFSVRPAKDGSWDIVDAVAPQDLIVVASSSRDIATAIAAFMGGDAKAADLWKSALERHNALLMD
ncbi:MAG TPA: hypothetical protein VEH77_18805 [Roseiarcus sp.]|nr:hypothetical protein [Roseiarcus sp.]